jgi:hypothetical protein
MAAKSLPDTLRGLRNNKGEDGLVGEYKVIWKWIAPGWVILWFLRKVIQLALFDLVAGQSHCILYL